MVDLKHTLKDKDIDKDRDKDNNTSYRRK